MLIKDVKLSRVVALFFAVLIIIGSSIPSKNIPRAFTITPDKLIHCCEYFVFGYFLFNWIFLELKLLHISSIALITLLAGSLMGVIDENYQRLTPGRSPDIWDWMLDTIGVIIAIAMVLFLKYRNRNLNK